jgi:hypothetical protein
MLKMNSCLVTYQPSLGFDEGSVYTVHLMVKSTGVTQVVARTIPSPQWGGHRPTVHTLTPLSKVIIQLCWREGDERGGGRELRESYWEVNANTTYLNIT